MEGSLGKEAASMVHVCRQTVSHYVPLFNEGGLELLLHRDVAPLREPFLTEKQQEEIKHLVLTTTPAELGWDWDIASAWNTKILQSYVHHRYGISISREALRKLLHRTGPSWARPTYTLAKGDPDQQKNFERQMYLIKNVIGPDSVPLYIDETPIRSYHVLRTTWSEVGHPKQVPKCGHHAHVSLFGTVNIHKGKTVLHQTTVTNTETFLDFLRMAKECYPDRSNYQCISQGSWIITISFKLLHSLSTTCTNVPRECYNA
ncbi:IS630 family transposase [Geobacillus sp. FSL W8-0032]